MKQIAQLVYTKDNIPTDNIITNAVDALGIQAPPGTTFSCNGGNEIEIGNTGIFEINLQNYAVITNLKIVSANLAVGDKIIIDMLCEDGGEIQ